MILVEGTTPEGQAFDLTRSARYRSLDPAVATVDGRGVVRPVADGVTAVVVDAGGHSRTVEVRVEGSSRARSFNFENDIVPVLSKLGCNASGCHGKAEGQNGFKLSVFGFDPEADHIALTRESRGRRIFPPAPERSLLLTKMSGAVPHGGGIRAGRDSDDYRTVRDWIAAGAPFGAADDARVVSVRVEPRERRLAMGRGQQLRVIARDSEGREFDATAHARFQSNNEGLASVDADGLVTARGTPGDVAVMASYLDSVDVFRALIPRPGGSGLASGTLAAGGGDGHRPHRRPGRPQAEGSEHRTLGAVHRRRIPPAGLPRRDRHAPHARGGAAVPGGPPSRPPRPAGRRPAQAARLRGLLGA